MTTQISINEPNFEEMEKRLLEQVVAVSKSMIESFKFRIIYDAKVTKDQSQKTLSSLKNFRTKNWDKTVSRKEAYRKYMGLY